MTTTASAGTRKRHTRILEQLDRVIELARDPKQLERNDPEVSAWSVSLQIEHMACVLRAVVDCLEKIAHGKADGPGHPTLIGRLTLLLGRIPRGRAKAPETVRPQSIDAEELTAGLARVRQRFTELDLVALEGTADTLPHHVFGSLTARRWLRMLEVHNHHHWKIVGDILHSR